MSVPTAVNKHASAGANAKTPNTDEVEADRHRIYLRRRHQTELEEALEAGDVEWVSIVGVEWSASNSRRQNRRIDLHDRKRVCLQDLFGV